MSSDPDELFEALLRDAVKMPNAPDPAQAAPPKRLGRYHLLRQIGSGGMGRVYLAQLQSEHGFERAVAVKLLHQNLAADASLVERFLDEARTASRIFHTNVCQILDVGTDAGQSYLVMEYLRGEPLSTLIAAAQPEPLPFEIAARVVADAARGLSGAHSARTDSGATMGIVHRDIKPSNIVVLFEGTSKVVDFGIAFARERQTSSVVTEVRGTLAYMAPEQLRDEDLDQRVDLWALGVTLWESTTGRRLFDQRSLRELQGQVLHGPIPDPRTIVPDYPEALAEIVGACLERDRDKRMGSASDMADRLERFLFDRGAGGHGAVAHWVAEHMTKEITERQELEQATLPITSMTDRIAAGEASPLIEGATGAGKLAGLLASKWTRYRWVIAVGLVLTVGAVFGLWSWRSKSESNSPSPASAAEAPGSALAGAPNADNETSSTAHGVDAGRVGQGSDARALESKQTRRVASSKLPRRTRTNKVSQMGTLDLMVLPSAQVFFRGRKLGQSPLRGEKLPVGTHTLTLRAADGRSKRVRVQVRAGQHTRMSISLDK